MSAAIATPVPRPTASLRRLEAEDLDALLLIRHFECALLDLYSRGLINGTIHTCLGQEYVPVALAPLLASDDFVFSNHRGHGHYLARYADPQGLLAEILGREGAICSGVGGSQHIFREGYVSTGVQGESMPVAVGVGIHLRARRPGAVAVVYIGDGTWGEGSVYEALNMAALWAVPLVVVVENNGIAQSTPTAGNMTGTIRGRAAAFGVAYHRIDTVDVAVIREQVRPMIASVRRAPRPIVLEFITHRLGPHSKGDECRDPAENAGRDWYWRYAAEYPDEFGLADHRMQYRVRRLVAEIEGRAPSRWTP
jgi:pyruvate dehydrogenase E1 component alpha subunit